MLKTVDFTGKFHKDDGCVMLLGGFDGLHIGHQKLLARAKTYEFPIGIMTIIGGKERNLFTIREREEIFRRAGIDFALELPFEEIKDLSSDRFAKALTEKFAPKAFVCGDDFRFGAQAQGTPETLKQATRVCVDVEELVKIDGEKVSSRTLKTLLKAGKLEFLKRLLGEEFFLLGEVNRDRGVGRTLGFPTANIVYPQEKYPLKAGVYESFAEVDGVTYKGVTNYGARPTFRDETVCAETHLDGFCGDLYGRMLEVRFVRFLREIRKFENADALKNQLAEDIRRIRKND